MEGFRMGTEPIIVKLLDSELALLNRIDNLSALVFEKAKSIGKEQGVPAQSRVKSAFLAVITEETGDEKLAVKAYEDKAWYHPELAKITSMFVSEQKKEKHEVLYKPVHMNTAPAIPKPETPISAAPRPMRPRHTHTTTPAWHPTEGVQRVLGADGLFHSEDELDEK